MTRKVKVVEEESTEDIVKVRKSDLLIIPREVNGKKQFIYSDRLGIVVARSSEGNLKGHALWLSSLYDWEIVEDSEGRKVLMATMKK